MSLNGHVHRDDNKLLPTGITIITVTNAGHSSCLWPDLFSDTFAFAFPLLLLFLHSLAAEPTELIARLADLFNILLRRDMCPRMSNLHERSYAYARCAWVALRTSNVEARREMCIIDSPTQWKMWHNLKRILAYFKCAAGIKTKLTLNWET